MTDLLTRLENAKEGSREMDAEIHSMLNPLYKRNSIYPGIFQHGTRDDVHQCPHYTTSLDAALTLVPEGCGWDVGFIAANASPTAHVWRYATDAEQAAIEADIGKTLPRGGVILGGKGSTPALALCIAALRARAA